LQEQSGNDRRCQRLLNAGARTNRERQGNKVKMAASAVIVIRRNRFLLDSRKASCAGMRCASSVNSDT
jgi:hypothetical protein